MAIIELEQTDGSIIELEISDDMIQGMSQEQILAMPKVQAALKSAGIGGVGSQVPAKRQEKITGGDDSPVWYDEGGPSMMEALLQGAVNFPQSMARVGTDFMDMATNPGKSLPMMLNAASGVMQNTGAALGLPQENAYNDPMQRAMGAALVDDYTNTYGDYGNFKNTIANDPARIALDVGAWAIPEGALAAGNQLERLVMNKTPMKHVPESMTEKLLAKAMPASEAALKGAAKTKLELGIPWNRKGLLEVNLGRRAIGKQLGQVFDELEAAGTTVSPLDVAASIRKAGADSSNVIAKPEIRAIYDKLADNWLNQIVHDYGNSALVNGIPVKDMQKYKKGTAKELQRYWKQFVKNEDVATSHQVDALLAGWRGAGRGIAETDARLPGLNKEYSQYATIQTFLENALAKERKKEWVGSDVTLPLAVEMAARGKPGVATAVAGGRRYGIKPVLDKGAQHLYNRREGKNIVTNKKVRQVTKYGSRAYSQGSYLSSLLDKVMEGDLD